MIVQTKFVTVTCVTMQCLKLTWFVEVPYQQRKEKTILRWRRVTARAPLWTKGETTIVSIKYLVYDTIIKYFPRIDSKRSFYECVSNIKRYFSGIVKNIVKDKKVIDWRIMIFLLLLFTICKFVVTNNDRQRWCSLYGKR